MQLNELTAAKKKIQSRLKRIMEQKVKGVMVRSKAWWADQGGNCTR